MTWRHEMEELLNLSPLQIVLAMIVVNERLIELLTTRFLDKLFENRGWDKSWILVLSWISGAGLVAATQINLFQPYIPNWWIGWLLTAIVAGGGSNLLHDLFSAIKPVRDLLAISADDSLAQAGMGHLYNEQLTARPGVLPIVEPDADVEQVAYSELANPDLIRDDGEVEGRPD